MDFGPSLLGLYRRSRYARDDENETLLNRRELFAVAAVALTAKCDEAFRKHFLQGVCRLDWTDGGGPEEFEIQVQFHDFDLVVSHKASRSIVVFEFKGFGAVLEHRQDPTNEKYFLDEPTGYGGRILAQNGYVRKTYILLDQFAPEFGEKRYERKQGALLCRACAWGDLLPDSERPSALWLDLLETLGQLGISTLKNSELEKMKNAHLLSRLFRCIQL